MTYAQRRAAALALAAAYTGWGRPPTPEGTPPVTRVVWSAPKFGRKRFRTADGGWEWGEGFVSTARSVPNTPALDAECAAKERRQNREKLN